MEETSPVASRAGPASPGSSPPPGEWTRVIVLAPEAPQAAGLSPTLSNEFQKRDWFAVVQHDPYLALAELALRERAQSARAAWGLQRMEGLALVVVEPARWPEALLRDLFVAVRRWLPPSVTIWTATDDRIDRATEPAARITSAPSNTTPADFDALIAALPRGPMTSTSPNGEEAASAHPCANRAASKPERLSREEIDMLLYEDEHSNNPHPGEGDR